MQKFWSLNIKGYIWPIIKQNSLNFCVNIAWYSTNILLKIHEITWSIYAILTNHEFLPSNHHPYHRFFFVFWCFFSFFLLKFSLNTSCYRLSWTQVISITKTRSDYFAFWLQNKKRRRHGSTQYKLHRRSINCKLLVS